MTSRHLEMMRSEIKQEISLSQSAVIRTKVFYSVVTPLIVYFLLQTSYGVHLWIIQKEMPLDLEYRISIYIGSLIISNIFLGVFIWAFKLIDKNNTCGCGDLFQLMLACILFLFGISISIYNYCQLGMNRDDNQLYIEGVYH